MSGRSGDGEFRTRVGFRKGLIVGGVSGVGAFGATLPLDFFKQYVQSGHGYRESFAVLRREGVSKMWRGMGVGSAVIFPQMAIKFGVYNGLHKWDVVKKGGLWGDVGAGFAAGFIDGSFLGPFLAVQAYQQMNTGISAGGAFKEVRRCGVGRFVTPLALRNGFYTAFMLGGVYPMQRALFGKGGSLNEYLFQIFIASSVLNLGGCMFSSPWDVIRAHQVDNLVAKGQRSVTKFGEVARFIWATEGVRGFYRGYVNYLVTFGLRFPLTVVFAELIKYRTKDWTL